MRQQQFRKHGIEKPELHSQASRGWPSLLLALSDVLWRFCSGVLLLGRERERETLQTLSIECARHGHGHGVCGDCPGEQGSRSFQSAQRLGTMSDGMEI